MAYHPDPYDCSKVYKEQLEPLLEEAAQICLKNGIPFFVACQTVAKIDPDCPDQREFVLTGKSVPAMHNSGEEMLAHLLIQKDMLDPLSTMVMQRSAAGFNKYNQCNSEGRKHINELRLEAGQEPYDFDADPDCELIEDDR